MAFWLTQQALLIVFQEGFQELVMFQDKFLELVMFSEKQAETSNFLHKNVAKKLLRLWANKQKVMADFLREIVHLNTGDVHVMIVHIKIGINFNLTFYFLLCRFTVQ